jgi:hypothetical protein
MNSYLIIVNYLRKHGESQMAKVDRKILKTHQENFDDITLQNLSDSVNVNRGTIYLLDKFDLLDKLNENI